MGAIVQDFNFETDDINEFMNVMKNMLPVFFNAGRNKKPEFHYMYYDLGPSPRYWMLEEDSEEDAPQRKCVIALSHHLNDRGSGSSTEVKVPMIWEEADSGNNWGPDLKWIEDSYVDLLKAIRKAIDDNIIKTGGVWDTEEVKDLPVNGWVRDESNIDGSHGMNFKARYTESTPGCMYISLGYCYYGK